MQTKDGAYVFSNRLVEVGIFGLSWTKDAVIPNDMHKLRNA